MTYFGMSWSFLACAPVSVRSCECADREAAGHGAFTPSLPAPVQVTAVSSGRVGFGSSAQRAADGAVAGDRPRLRPAGRAHGPLGADRACASASGSGSTTPTSPRSTTSASSPTSAARSTATRPPRSSATTSTSAPRRSQIDLAGFPAMMFMLRRAGSDGRQPRNRARAGRAAHGHRRAGRWCSRWPTTARPPASSPIGSGSTTTCAPGSSRRTPGGTARACPATCRATRSSLAARISHVAEACEVFAPHSAASTTRSRWSARGAAPTSTPRSPTPSCADPDALFDGIDDDTVDEFLDAEPVDAPDAHRRRARPTRSRRSATSATCAARTSPGTLAARPNWSTPRRALLQLTPDEARLVRRAALVHDVGRFGVPGIGVGQARTAQRHRRGAHADARVLRGADLQRPEPLRRIGLLAATHHERMDGSGYHRGVGGTMLVDAGAAPRRRRRVPRHDPAASVPRGAHARATRPASCAPRSTPDGSTGDAVDAVLAAAGHAPSRSRATGGPAGLTAARATCSGCSPRGCPTRRSRDSSGISPKTVGNHVEHIYTKLGVNNRAGAALRAMEYGMVGATPTLA